MCGLIGYSGEKSPNLFYLNFIMADNDSRGGHSSGIMIGNHTEKCVGVSANLLPSMQNFTHLNQTVVIAHTRYATHGIKSAANSHPYKYGNITGAHNGVLSNYEEVCEKHNLTVPDVDSKTIFNLLNTTKDYTMLSELDGTMCVLFTDREDNLYVYRRNNPLFMARVNDSVYFSSLEKSLSVLTDDVVEVPKDVLQTWCKGKLISTVAIVANPVPATKIVNTDWSAYGKTTKSTKTSWNDGWSGYNYGSSFSDQNDLPTAFESFNDDYVGDELDDVYDMADQLDDLVWDNHDSLSNSQSNVLTRTADYLRQTIANEVSNEKLTQE